VDAAGVTLVFAEPVTSVALSYERLGAMRVAIRAQMIAANEPWADLTGAPSVEVGGPNRAVDAG
jgi:hypothetical protein